MFGHHGLPLPVDASGRGKKRSMFTLDYEANNAPLSGPSTSAKSYLNDTQLLFRQFCALPVVPPCPFNQLFHQGYI